MQITFFFCYSGTKYCSESLAKSGSATFSEKHIDLLLFVEYLASTLRVVDGLRACFGLDTLLGVRITVGASIIHTYIMILTHAAAAAAPCAYSRIALVRAHAHAVRDSPDLVCSRRACALPRLACARIGVHRSAGRPILPSHPTFNRVVEADRAGVRASIAFERSPDCQRARVTGRAGPALDVQAGTAVDGPAGGPGRASSQFVGLAMKIPPAPVNVGPDVCTGPSLCIGMHRCICICISAFVGLCIWDPPGPACSEQASEEIERGARGRARAKKGLAASAGIEPERPGTGLARLGATGISTGNYMQSYHDAQRCQKYAGNMHKICIYMP